MAQRMGSALRVYGHCEWYGQVYGLSCSPSRWMVWDSPERMVVAEWLKKSKKKEEKNKGGCVFLNFSIYFRLICS